MCVAAKVTEALELAPAYYFINVGKETIKLI